MTITRKRFRVSGIVQGVGFRPFVWRLANAIGCSGHVCNDANGVSIEVQAPADRLDAFQTRLQSDAPTAARIKRVAAEQLAIVPNESGFTIIESQLAASVAAWVAPDVGVCDDCLHEMQDPNNRRYGYPFINCTACGPRFTIIASLPYDRSRTTMHDFELCTDCRTEYESPSDRRFHAEPNACSLCGPAIWFASSLDGDFQAARHPSSLGTHNPAAEGVPDADRPADLVLGQADMSGSREWPYDLQGERRLRFPYAIAFQGNRLAVADTANNRILFWRLPINEPAFAPACDVIGQVDFTKFGENHWQAVTDHSLCWPYGIHC